MQTASWQCLEGPFPALPDEGKLPVSRWNFTVIYHDLPAFWTDHSEGLCARSITPAFFNFKTVCPVSSWPPGSWFCFMHITHIACGSVRGTWFGWPQTTVLPHEFTWKFPCMALSWAQSLCPPLLSIHQVGKHHTEIGTTTWYPVTWGFWIMIWWDSIPFCVSDRSCKMVWIVVY